jgi:uncharacterized membrane protein YsdA (DUF1294 family)
VGNSIDKVNSGEEIAKTGEKKLIVFIILALLNGWIGLIVDMALPEQPGEQSCRSL